jgi:hypothetical protein
MDNVPEFPDKSDLKKISWRETFTREVKQFCPNRSRITIRQ